MSIKKGYVAVTDGPPPQTWDDYRKLVTDAWRELLSDDSNREPEVHRFLKMHPCLVPGHDAFHASYTPPGPIYASVFTNPPLPGITTKRPDFMWLPTDSQIQWIVLVELEDPNKRWFTGSGQQTAVLTQAVNQVLEWKSLLSEPTNLRQFMNLYDVGRRPVALQFCLVYGRRREAKQGERRPGFRRTLQHSDIKWMTYDRLRPNEAARDWLCSKAVDGNRFEAVSVPATLKITPDLAYHWRSIQGKPDAVRRSPYFSTARREFLSTRFEYWDDFLVSYDGYPSGDEEE